MTYFFLRQSGKIKNTHSKSCFEAKILAASYIFALAKPLILLISPYNLPYKSAISLSLESTLILLLENALIKPFSPKTIVTINLAVVPIFKHMWSNDLPLLFLFLDLFVELLE